MHCIAEGRRLARLPCSHAAMHFLIMHLLRFLIMHVVADNRRIYHNSAGKGLAFMHQISWVFQNISEIKSWNVCPWHVVVWRLVVWRLARDCTTPDRPLPINESCPIPIWIPWSIWIKLKDEAACETTAKGRQLKLHEPNRKRVEVVSTKSGQSFGMFCLVSWQIRFSICGYVHPMTLP